MAGGRLPSLADEGLAFVHEARLTHAVLAHGKPSAPADLLDEELTELAITDVVVPSVVGQLGHVRPRDEALPVRDDGEDPLVRAQLEVAVDHDLVAGCPRHPLVGEHALRVQVTGNIRTGFSGRW